MRAEFLPDMSLGIPHRTQHQLQPKQTLSTGPLLTKYAALQSDNAKKSRVTSTPHYHARAAAALARSNPASMTVTITDPNNPSKIVASLPSKIVDDKDELDTTQQKEQTWTTLDIGGMGIMSIASTLFSYTFLTTLYMGHNNLTKLSPSISNLVNLHTLDISSNKLTSIPPELGLLVNLRKLLLFDNGLRTLPYELGTLFQLEFLGLEGNPIDPIIASLLSEKGTKGLIADLRDTAEPDQRLPIRDYIQLESDDKDASYDNDGSLSDEKFTVLSYNVLCQKYATEQAYGYTARWALEREYRKALIVNEILSRNADIVCLQEVEMSEYEEYLKEKMAKDGDYVGRFFPKSRARTMAEEQQRAVDGCATFYKRKKFKCTKVSLLEYNQKAVQRKQLFDNSENIYNRVMTKDNIAVMMMLEVAQQPSPHSPSSSPSPRRIVIANSHIHWDPSFADVKLVQVGMLMDEVERFASADGAPVSDIPTIICGDFNSEPSSGVYEFLSKGVVEKRHRDFGNHMYGSYTSDGLKHKLSLKSAYSHIGELSYTNYTPRFKGVLDYIWFTNNTMDLMSLLGPIDPGYMSRAVGFPNAHFPSDHIPIMAELRFRPRRREKLPEPNFGSTAANKAQR